MRLVISLLLIICFSKVMANSIKDIVNFRWINQPIEWNIQDEEIHVVTDKNTDFWQGTWYGFHRHNGHVYGTDIKEDFTFQVCVEANFTTLYDQAGLMFLSDEKYWMKAGIEYNDGQPMIGSVLTNENSDWATGLFTGNPKKFWMRLTKEKNSLRLQYSTDGVIWPLLRLSPVVDKESYFIGVMCCTPERGGLAVKFSDIKLTAPLGKDLHDLS